MSVLGRGPERAALPRWPSASVLLFPSASVLISPSGDSAVFHSEHRSLLLPRAAVARSAADSTVEERRFQRRIGSLRSATENDHGPKGPYCRYSDAALKGPLFHDGFGSFLSGLVRSGPYLSWAKQKARLLRRAFCYSTYSMSSRWCCRSSYICSSCRFGS